MFQWLVKMPMSSAYYVHWQGGVVGVSFTYRRNSSGLRMLPCGVPASKLTFSDRLVPVFTWIVLFFKNDTTMRSRSGGMF